MPNTSSYSRDLACFRTPQARRQPGKRFLRHPIAVSPSVSCSSCLPRPGVVVTGVTVGGPVEGGASLPRRPHDMGSSTRDR